MSIEECKEDIAELKQQIMHNTLALTEIKVQLVALQSSSQSLETILKYVVTPLIAVVGTLVGVNLLA